MNEMDADFSLDDRLPCSDGACVGIIGADGRCGTCGRAYEGDERLPLKSSRSTDGDDSFSEKTGEEAADPLLKMAEPPGDPEERICCADDTCIGIIGEDGKCGTCGKPSPYPQK